MELPPRDVTEELVTHLWFREYLPTIGALIWFQTGEHPPPPPLHLVEVLQVSSTAQNLLAELELRTVRHTGQTLIWLKDHGMIDERGRKVRYLAVDPERFAACECTWCGEVDSALAATDNPKDQRHVAAIGHAYIETGLNFAAEVP